MAADRDGGGGHIVAEVSDLVPTLRKLVADHRAAATAPSDGTGPFVSDADVEDALAALDMLAVVEPEPALPVGAIDRLAAFYALSPFERIVLVAACAPDVDPHFATVFAYLHDDIAAAALSTGLALDLAGLAAWDGQARAALSVDSTLVRSGLLGIAASGSFHRRQIVAADRVVQHLLGDDRLPPPIERCLAPVIGVDHPAVTMIENLFDADEWFVYLRGTGDGAEAVAVQALERAGVAALHVDLRRAPATLPVDQLVSTAVREAVLQRSALLIGPIDALATDSRQALDEASSAPVPVIAYGRTSWDPTWSQRAPVLVEAPGLDLHHRLAVWNEAIQAVGLDVDPTHAATTYQLSPADILRGVRAAALHARSLGTAVDDAALAHGVRSQNAITLEQLARRVSPRATKGDLVLPDPANRELAELVGWVENRDRLIDDWGMRGQGTKGRGVTGLFVGSSGTGKTLAAEVVAGELGLDLYVVDLSTVVSKYIGETEENLERVFREAMGVNGVLFFDEADALFGKRTGVSDSKDRFANMEVAYLLQRMEQFDGVSLLASNLRANLDDAFTRRLDFVITFPDPSPPERERIWELHLPPSIPRAGDVDLRELARRFDLAGGEIANVAKAAGHAALRAGGPVTMEQLVQAVAREYSKMGRLVRHDDFGDWLDRLDR